MPVINLNRVVMTIILWIAVAAASAVQAQDGFAAMSFDDAIAPYTSSELTYTGDGKVTRPDGRITGGGLACSTFVSPVLHRMKFGDAWLANFDHLVQRGYGDQIAANMGLALTATLASGDVASERISALVADGTLPAGLYMFNTRHDDHGHVGFVLVAADGSLSARHFSGLGARNGYVAEPFGVWYAASMYRTQPVELYRVPR